MNAKPRESEAPAVRLQGILGDRHHIVGSGASAYNAPAEPAHTIMRMLFLPLKALFKTAAAVLPTVIVSLPSQAAIPLLGPCDPDFRMTGSCSPGTVKEERPAAPAVPAKPAKPVSPATSTPAPLKSSPAAKTPTDSRPEVTTQVSMPAEDNCPKTQRADTTDDGPLVTVSLHVWP